MRAFAVLALVGCGAPPTLIADMPCAPPERFTARGFFRVEKACDRWHLIAPDGARTFSTGVNHVSWNGEVSPSTKQNPYADAVRARYGSEEKWARATTERLRAWGWNTVGDDPHAALVERTAVVNPR